MRQPTLFIAALCCTMMSYATEGALNGKFTINEQGDKIVFSQGNLQYQSAHDTWQFADTQYVAIGKGNENITKPLQWIDLFGWGTGNSPKRKSEFDDDYPTFVDWGVNPISNGGNADSLWRTIKYEELEYLLFTRDNHDSLRGCAVITDQYGHYLCYGYILLPDNWIAPDGLSFKGNPPTFGANHYTEDQWPIMEAAGAVFLPGTGTRNNAEVAGAPPYSGGNYWTDYQGSEGTGYLQFSTSAMLNKTTTWLRHIGMGVRLIQDYQETPTSLDNTDADNTAKKCIINGQLFILHGEKVYTVEGQEVK